MNVTDSYVWAGKQSTDIIMRPVFLGEDMTSYVRVMPMIKSKERIPLDIKFQKLLRSKDACDTTAGNSIINNPAMDIEVCPIGFREELCGSDFLGTFREDALKSGVDLADIDGTTIKTYIETKITEALAIDVPRIFWFGDTASSNAAYNACDGIWKRIFSRVGAYGINRTTITSGIKAAIEAPNASETNALAVIGLFGTLYYGADADFKSVSNSEKDFIVTGSLFDALDQAYDYLMAKNGFIEGLKKQDDKLFYKGIEVIPMRKWDEWIKEDLSNEFPHRAVFTTTKGKFQNLVLGVDLKDSGSKFEFFYDRYHKKNVFEGDSLWGTQIIFDFLIRVAY